MDVMGIMDIFGLTKRVFVRVVVVNGLTWTDRWKLELAVGIINVDGNVDDGNVLNVVCVNNVDGNVVEPNALNALGVKNVDGNVVITGLNTLGVNVPGLNKLAWIADVVSELTTAVGEANTGEDKTNGLNMTGVPMVGWNITLLKAVPSWVNPPDMAAELVVTVLVPLGDEKKTIWALARVESPDIAATVSAVAMMNRFMITPPFREPFTGTCGVRRLPSTTCDKHT